MSIFGKNRNVTITHYGREKLSQLGNIDSVMADGLYDLASNSPTSVSEMSRRKNWSMGKAERVCQSLVSAGVAEWTR